MIWRDDSCVEDKITKMIGKQILGARDHSYKNLKREIIETSEQKLTLNIAYYPAFENVRNILQLLHLLLAPDKEHKEGIF